MNTPRPGNDRLIDLLIQEATEALSPADQSELAELSGQMPATERDAVRHIVAALTVAARSREKLPAALRSRILAEAPGATARSRSGGLPPSSGWWAAAACLLLAVAGWWPRLMQRESAVAPAAVTDLSRARAALLQQGGAIQVQLKAGPGAGNAPLTGDVVFDPLTQRGYMHFHGIPANDPRLARYQLWIADRARAEPEPVDGGLFDVTAATTAGKDVIVPFSAKLPVSGAAAFVVTVEKPAGVVVSKQERVLAVGTVAAGV
jgi:hypothetical protein